MTSRRARVQRINRKRPSYVVTVTRDPDPEAAEDLIAVLLDLLAPSARK